MLYEEIKNQYLIIDKKASMHLLKMKTIISLYTVFYLFLILISSIFNTEIYSQEQANYANENLTSRNFAALRK